jgi:hypothetical protein
MPSAREAGSNRRFGTVFFGLDQMSRLASRSGFLPSMSAGTPGRDGLRTHLGQRAKQ